MQGHYTLNHRIVYLYISIMHWCIDIIHGCIIIILMHRYYILMHNYLNIIKDFRNFWSKNWQNLGLQRFYANVGVPIMYCRTKSLNSGWKFIGKRTTNSWYSWKWQWFAQIRPGSITQDAIWKNGWQKFKKLCKIESSTLVGGRKYLSL